MKRVELYQEVRCAVMIDIISRGCAASHLGIDRKTIDKMPIFPEPARAEIQPQAGGVHRNH